ncbi:uncharacterized protein LOC128952047 [Oppia nitens]|uniref:uncharacterized protein LOC128952047 n=1 Tax=Oppia nitens TaxID=1686743 RepID=UPI0023DA829A|nr:uncharacterized protein LOC128952047 [Oppia nitens]
MFDNKCYGDYIAASILWTAVLVYGLINWIVSWCCLTEQAIKYFSKDCDPNDRQTIKYRYLVTIMIDPFSATVANNIRKQYNSHTGGGNLYVELITKSTSRMISVTVPFGKIRNGRAHILLYRQKLLRPVTKVRAIHDIVESLIYLRGVRITDQLYGYTVYYGVEQDIQCESMDRAVAHPIVLPVPRLLSDEMFAPMFAHFKNNTLSTTRIKCELTDIQSNGVVLAPEINLCEDIIFISCFMATSFLLIPTIALSLDKWLASEWLSKNVILAVTVVAASGLAYNGINCLALVYRSCFKRPYERHWSPKTKELTKCGTCWCWTRAGILTVMLMAAIAVSLAVPIIICCLLPSSATTTATAAEAAAVPVDDSSPSIRVSLLPSNVTTTTMTISSNTTTTMTTITDNNNINNNNNNTTANVKIANNSFAKHFEKQWLKNRDLNETLVMTVLLTATVCLSFTVWLFVCGFCRYLYCLAATTKYKSFGELVDNSKDFTDDSLDKTHVPLGTDVVMKELSSDNKNPTLKTGSIHRPISQSMFADPEKFRMASEKFKSPQDKSPAAAASPQPTSTPPAKSSQQNKTTKTSTKQKTINEKSISSRS